MLQQTQVKTVVGYYERWMERFPSVAVLAVADEAAVLHAWQGLGYYSRARRLLAGARAVAERYGGELPRNVGKLLELPGIGPYSAGAIASIAFGLPEPVVDGNVVRVLCRMFALRGDPERSPLKAALWQLARELVPHDKPSEFNQALMELGATICTPTSARCVECPLAGKCAALAQGLERALPEPSARKAPTDLATAAALVERADSVLLRQVPENATRWAGLWVLPFVELASDEGALNGSLRALGELARGGKAQGVTAELRHTITRFRIRLSVVACSLPARAKLLSASAGFFTRAEIRNLALPSVHARFLANR